MRETPVADNEDKPLPPVFQGDKDKTNARQIAGRVIDPLGFEKHYRTDPDGTVVRYETKGGMPRVYTERPDPHPEWFIYSGITVMPRNIKTKIDQIVLLKLITDGSRPLKVGVRKPPQTRNSKEFSYAILAGDVGGLAVKKEGSTRCFWMHGEYKTHRHMFIWKLLEFKRVEATEDDGKPIPFAKKIDAKWQHFIATQVRVFKRDDTLIYTMSVPERTVLIDTGPKKYDLLPVQVSYAFDKAVLQCVDSQTFLDRPTVGSAVVTDLTRYYHTVVVDVKTPENAQVIDGKLEVFLPDYTITGSSSDDGYAMASLYPGHGYRSWYDFLTPSGNIAEVTHIRVMTATGAGNLEVPACADSNTSTSLNASLSTPFTRSVFEDSVVPANYNLAVTYGKSEAITQEYSNTGMTDPFINEARQSPYQFTGSRKVFKGILHVAENLDMRASVSVGDVEFVVFRSSGSSSTNADKHSDVRFEHFHPPWGNVDDGTWNGVYDTQGLTMGKALEDACGYSYDEMISWSEISGIGTSKEVKKVDYEDAVRESSCAFDATGLFYLAADATLGFWAAIEFHFDYNFTDSSAGQSYMWILPEVPAKHTVNARVSIVVSLRGNEYREVLADVQMFMPPPVKSKAYPNPYYFIPLHYGIAPASELSEAGADVCWAYQVPKFEPQPSFFVSLDTILETQQTSEFVAGYSTFEMDKAASKRPALAKFEKTVVASRRVKLREAKADWLFSYYGVDRAISLASGETDAAKTRKYGFSDELYDLMFNKTVRFEFDTDTIRYWIEDINDEAVTPEEDKNAYCFRV